MNVDDGVATVDLGEPDLESELLPTPAGPAVRMPMGQRFSRRRLLKPVLRDTDTFGTVEGPWTGLRRCTWWSWTTAVWVDLFCGETILES